MADGQDWQRDKNGFRFDFQGINTVLGSDLLPEFKYPYAANVRRYKQGRITGRAVEQAGLFTLPSPVHSVRRLNDSTPAGPGSGFTIISGAGTSLYAGASSVATGLSGAPLSLVPFRPNQSVQPWMYVADENKMLKVRSDGTTYQDGVKEPQVAPSVTANVAASVISILGNVSVYVWGDSPHSGPVGQYVWRKADDTGSTGTSRSLGNESVDSTGNSLMFDASPFGDNATPMQWSILDATGTVTGTKSLFEPALESAGYQDFNFVATCSLYVPTAGTYSFRAQFKDRIMWGIGTGPNGAQPTWTGKGSTFGTLNQKETVLQGYPLLPAAAANDGGGYTGDQTVSVTFPVAGIYGFELNYDYWFHSNRHCIITVGGANIPPITTDVFTGAQYRYTYRSSATGATSNPSPASVAITLPVKSTDLVPTASTDPQVDKVDWYRFDQGLLNWTYVGTSPNTATAFHDGLLDTDVANNPLLQFDNYEPFPSIDLPRKGTVNVAAGSVEGTMQVTWVSGDTFNVRWLPGTIMTIGTVAYTLYNRPTSTTQVTVELVGDMPTTLTGLTYEIAEPILAAQPMPAMWGPTDNVNFMFACGDPLRPGVLYWTKGNNPDSAPDTNQQDVTSPSEPLMNGCIVGGIGMVFSSERAWLIYPNFFNALATVTGTTGAAWSLVESIANRGLYIRKCICTDGGSTVFFRAKDGIYVSPGGNGSVSITDDLYNLFPHEGLEPVPVTVASYTIYPPDDTNPDAQQLSSANGYVYYDYEDANGTPRTLVYDIFAKAWCVDTYQFPAVTHSLEEGPDVNGVLVGCTDGTVRPMGHAGTETTSVCVLATQAVNAGDTRANKRVGDLFFKATVENSVSIAAYQTRYTVPVVGFSPTSLAVGAPHESYVVDFTTGTAIDIDDVECILSWTVGDSTVLDLWQPNFIQLPENVQDRPTDWTDCGYPGAKFIQGVTLEANTFAQNKVFKIQNGDDRSFITPNETPCNFNGQSIQTFSFSPFIAHNVRMVSTDGVPWRRWGVKYIFEPYPEECTEWTTELVSYGVGWQHVRMLNIPYIATAAVSVSLYFDQWPTITLTNILPATTFSTVPTKTKVQVPANKSKLIGFSLVSTQPFRPFKQMLEVIVGDWGRTDSYQVVQPFGGQSSDGAEA